MSGITTLVIAHGRSEIQFCEYLSKQTRVPMHIHARNNGMGSIQINGIRDELSSYPFDSYVSLKREFPRLEYLPDTNRKRFSEDRSDMPKLAIFPILDTDDSPLLVKPYISGELIKGCPMERHVVPVYNVRNLDGVFQRYGADVDVSNKTMSYRKLLESLDLEDFYGFLKSDEGTNLDRFVGHCLSRSPRRMSWYDGALAA